MKKLTLLFSFLINFVYICTAQNYIGKQKCDVLYDLKGFSSVITITNAEEPSFITCENSLLGIPFVYFFDSNYVCNKYIVMYKKQDREDLSEYLSYLLTKINYDSWIDKSREQLYTIITGTKSLIMSVEPLKTNNK